MPTIGQLTRIQLGAWPTIKSELCWLGVERITEFCRLNSVPVPDVFVVPKAEWSVSACAYYRPDTKINQKWMNRLAGQGPGINICLEYCGRSCDDSPGRNWSWPSSDTDREPYGVLCHELGHHCDWLAGVRKGAYFSDYCETVIRDSWEKGLTSYANENPAEWFAEAFRLFVTNPSLLSILRPRTHRILTARWKPVETRHWRDVLGTNVPAKVLRTLTKKVAR